MFKFLKKSFSSVAFSLLAVTVLLAPAKTNCMEDEDSMFGDLFGKPEVDENLLKLQNNFRTSSLDSYSQGFSNFLKLGVPALRRFFTNENVGKQKSKHLFCDYNVEPLGVSNIIPKITKQTYELATDTLSGTNNFVRSKINNTTKKVGESVGIQSNIEHVFSKVGKGVNKGVNKLEIDQILGSLGKQTGKGAGQALKNIKISSLMNSASKDVANGLKGAAKEATNTLKSPEVQNLQKEFKANLDKAKKEIIKEVSMVANDAKRYTLDFGAKIAGISILSLAGLTLAYYGTKTALEIYKANYNRPQIIIEFYKKTLFTKIRDLLFEKKEMQMIFNKDLQNRLNEIAKATKNINNLIGNGKTNVKYRNLMLYGLPGTGKTMFARKLAKESGLEFAMMSGSSFTKAGALEEMDKLFKWANNSKGLLLFIDEAESFLLKRENMETDSYGYKVLTNFLNYTGTRSDKFMIVMATNRLSEIDSAIYRRVDDLVMIPLPGDEERFNVLKLYRDKILLDVKQNGKEFVESVKQYLTDSKVDAMAFETKGLSNGDLEGIINAIKTTSDITDNGLVTQEIVDKSVKNYVEKQKQFAEAIAKKDLQHNVAANSAA